MSLADAGSTHPTLLGLLADWDDHEAWLAFQEQYAKLLKHCCSSMRLDAHATDEVCQNTWIQVANRIDSFVYDPNGSFRGWLWNVCRFEALKYLNSKKKDQFFTLESRDEWIANDPGSFDEGDDRRPEDDPVVFSPKSSEAMARLNQEVDRIQEAVRKRVAPHTWEAFWLVAVCFWTVKETASKLEMRMASVQKANQRVRQMLEAEGLARLGELTTVE